MSHVSCWLPHWLRPSLPLTCHHVLRVTLKPGALGAVNGTTSELGAAAALRLAHQAAARRRPMRRATAAAATATVAPTSRRVSAGRVMAEERVTASRSLMLAPQARQIVASAALEAWQRGQMR